MNEETVFIGKKELMSYVLAVITQLNNGSDKVVIKARGRAISRAVDVAQVSVERFLNDVHVKDIRIGTEEVSGRDGNPTKVSSMEITLSK